VTPLAHIAGVPVEELIPFTGLGGALWLAARMVVSRLQ
jgi:hypothetical protein